MFFGSSAGPPIGLKHKILDEKHKNKVKTQITSNDLVNPPAKIP